MLEINDFGPGSIEDKSTEEIAQIFFLLNQEHKELLSDEKILTEIHRRVSVFFDALEDSGGVYDVFEAAYKNTLYSLEKNKQQYLQGIAQGFISLLLFGNDEHKIEPNQDIDYINSRIEGLFRDISSPLADEIKNMLQYMIKKGYPQQNINRLGLMNEIKTPISTLFDILDGIKGQKLGNIDNIDWTNVLFDLYIIKRKYLEIAHTLYTKEDRSCLYKSFENLNRYDKYENLDLDVDLAGFEQLLIKAIDILPQLEQIQQNEIKLSTYVMNIIYNDTDGKKEDKNIGKLIKQHISEYSLSSKYSLRYDAKPIYHDMKANNFHNHYNQIIYFINNIEFPSPLFGQILDEYAKYKTIKTFDTYMGKPDFQQIEQDKQQFGAKGAYMNALKLFIDKFNKYIESKKQFKLEFITIFQVPQYEPIETTYYELRKSTGKLSKEYFKNLFTNRKEKEIDIIIRSSAEYSEDNDTSTGAGIYHSEVIYKSKLTYNTFCDAIRNVYKSCDSENAINYRKEQGIKDESMGIIIQEYIDGGVYGYANSILPHRPELSEVSLGSHPGFRPIINKKELETSLIRHMVSENLKKIFHYKIDITRRDIGMFSLSQRIAGINFLLEKYFGRPIQLEFVNGEIDNLLHLNLVQTRPLPKKLIEPHPISFPKDIKPLRTGRCIGVCDKELDIVSTGDDNRKTVGAVVFTNNFFASEYADFVRKSIPKDGVVIILNEGGDKGHIETLCVEKGIVCFFPAGDEDGDLDDITNIINKGTTNNHTVQISHKDFKGYKKIRVVANGLEGRIYGIDEPQTK